MDDDRPVLVIGATGFLGRRVVSGLTADGHRVRCLVRDPRRAADLLADRVEVVRGDMLAAETVSAAAQRARAVIVCVHTLSPQPGRQAGHGFVDVEAAGAGNIIDACRAKDVSRLLYVTSIGVASDARSSWLRGRARVEELLFTSGLDVTVRPGMIVGHGGDGFGMVERGARRRAAVLLSSPRQRFRTVAVDDLARQLVALLGDPRSFGRHFDVGSDDVLTIDEMLDLAAEHLGRPHPAKVHLPRSVIARIAPAIERAARMPPGAVRGFVGEGSDADMIGDTTAIRALLDQPPWPFREAMAQALHEGSATTAAPARSLAWTTRRCGCARAVDGCRLRRGTSASERHRRNDPARGTSRCIIVNRRVMTAVRAAQSPILNSARPAAGPLSGRFFGLRRRRCASRQSRNGGCPGSPAGFSW